MYQKFIFCGTPYFTNLSDKSLNIAKTLQSSHMLSSHKLIIVDYFFFFFYSHELTYMSATNRFMPLGQSSGNYLFSRLKGYRAINTSYNFPGYVFLIVFQSESWKQSDIDSRSLYCNLITNQINANHIGHPLVTLDRNRSIAPHDLAQSSSILFVISTNMKCI